MSADYFSSKTYSSGKSSVMGKNDRLPVAENIAHTPGNCLRLSYKNAPGGQWSATIFYREKRGMDHFQKANSLSIWVYKSSFTSVMHELPQVQLMRRDSSFTAAFKLRKLKDNTWQQVKIPVSAFIGQAAFDPSNFIAVCFSMTNGIETSEHTLFLDDIEFIDAGIAKPVSNLPLITSASTAYPMHIDITWDKITDENIRFVKLYRSFDEKHLEYVGVQQPYINRYSDSTGK